MFLRVSREIEQVKRHGHRASTHFFNLLFFRKADSFSQVGIVVGKRFGIAVRRNRAKRIFRELVRETYPDLAPGFALLIFPKRDAIVEPFQDLKTAWIGSLRKQRLLSSKPL